VFQKSPLIGSTTTTSGGGIGALEFLKNIKSQQRAQQQVDSDDLEEEKLIIGGGVHQRDSSNGAESRTDTLLDQQLISINKDAQRNQMRD
jgi:hypothetical protein